MHNVHPFRNCLARKAILRLLAACALELLAGGGVVRAQTEIGLEAEASQRIYTESADNTVYVQARIRVPAEVPGELSETVRNVALVIDRSGSMAGESIQSAREAVTAALGALGERDVVSVVLFGSEVETLVEAQRCDQARAQFARTGEIEAEGGAALYDGLSQAAAQLRRYAVPGTVNQLVLLSDGPSTKGPREPDDFARLTESLVHEGITVSTIGIGAEFDEDLLASLARIGGGRFHFAERPARIVEAVLVEVAPLRAVVARDAVLTLEYRNFCDEVKAHGARPAAVEKEVVTYGFPQLFAGQDVSVLVSGVLPAFYSRMSQRNLVRVRLSWTDVASGAVRELVRTISCSFSMETRVLGVTRSGPGWGGRAASRSRRVMRVFRPSRPAHRCALRHGACACA